MDVQATAAPHRRTFTNTELVKVVESMTFAADLADTSTWFDASTALPH